MDEYYKLADAYFKEFEPRSAFPGLKNYHWYLWVLTLASFCYFAYQVFVEDLPTEFQPYWSFYISEVLFLVVCGLIGLYRFKHTVRTTSEESELRPIDRLAIAKRARLEKLFGKTSWQFTEVVEGITNLRALEKKFRTPFDEGLVEFLESLYTPKTQAKLLALIASLLTLLIGLISKSEGFSLTELLTNEGKRNLVIAISKLILITLVASVAFYFFFRQMLAILPLIISSVLPILRSDQVILDYVIRDLIKYQTMAPQTALVEEPPLQPALQLAQHQTGSPAEVKPFNGFLLTALVIHTAYTAWQASKHKPPR